MIEHKDQKKELASRKERKQYTKPELTNYGHVEKLTQTGGSVRNDVFNQKQPL